VRYPYVLLDLDHTLIDSKAAEDAAFRVAMTDHGVTDPQRHLDAYVELNRAMWKAAERGEYTPEQVRHLRFERFVSRIDLEVDPRSVSDSYTAALVAESRFFPGAADVVGQLASMATLALITNGLSDVQRSRIDLLGLEPFFAAIVISTEVGHTKPEPGIFTHAFEALGSPDKAATLMVGDSLTSDIAGGVRYGIDTCWYNPTGMSPDGVHPTFQITRLEQLPGLVRQGTVE